MTHEAFDADTAYPMTFGTQGRMDPRRAISPVMGHMDPPDLGQQGAIGRLARTFWLATPGIIPRRRDAISALPRKCAAFFFRISRSKRRRSLSRRRRAFSAAKSAPACGIAPAYGGAAAIPHAPRHPCSAGCAASKAHNFEAEIAKCTSHGQDTQQGRSDRGDDSEKANRDYR